MLRTKVKQWIDHSGRIWLFRITVLTGIVVTTLSAFGFYPLSTNTILVFIISLFLIFTEIFFSEILEMRKTSREGQLLGWNSAIPLIREDVRQAKSLIIIARSGETFYYALRDVLLERGNKTKVELILTKTIEDDEEFSDYQKGWTKRWRGLSEETGGHIQINIVTAVLEVQALIVDEQSAYLGYRKQPVGTKAIPLTHLRISSESNQGQFLISLYKAWITRHLILIEAGSNEKKVLSSD